MESEFQHLSNLEQLLQGQEDDCDDFDEGFCRIAEMSPAEYASFLELRAATTFGQVWSRYRSAMFTIADDYGRGSSDRQKAIRETILQYPNVRLYLGTLIDEQSWRVNTQNDEQLTNTLLLMLAIADLGDDPAAQSIMTNLYHQAKQAGIKIDSLVSSVAINASDTPTGNRGYSTQQFFKTFAPTKGW